MCEEKKTSSDAQISEDVQMKYLAKLVLFFTLITSMFSSINAIVDALTR